MRPATRSPCGVASVGFAFVALLWIFLVWLIPTEPQVVNAPPAVPIVAEAPDDVADALQGRMDITQPHSVAQRAAPNNATTGRAHPGGVGGGAAFRYRVALDDINPPPWSNRSVRDLVTEASVCPKFRLRFGKDADSQVNHEAYVKYSRYVDQYCNNSGLLQMYVGLPTYLFFLDTIAQLLDVRNNTRIFDWGCGCGTLLNYYHLKYNTTGVGIDLVDTAIAHARARSQPRQTFCVLDGRLLKSFADNSFDTIVSWATIYHVRRTLLQCDIVHNLVRMLKPGGRFFFGHIRTEKSQDYWKKGKCRPDNVTVKRIRDYRTFHMPSFRKHQFFSMVFYKAPLNGSLALVSAGGKPLPDDDAGEP